MTLAKRIAAMAELHRVKIAQHCWGGAVSLMANLHFGLTQRACAYVEYPRHPNPLRDELLDEYPEIREGFVSPPTRPGLGVTLTEEVLRKYRAKSGERAGLVFQVAPTEGQ
jgi:L-alanine-DL-glutamate epimerase-like enolase superfamily enzyme